MKPTIALIILTFAIASCGANGEPVAPVLTGSQSVSVNSNSGLSTSTHIGVVFGGQ